MTNTSDLTKSLRLLWLVLQALDDGKITVDEALAIYREFFDHS